MSSGPPPGWGAPVGPPPGWGAGSTQPTAVGPPPGFGQPKAAPAPTATPSGLYSVNAGVNVIGDYLTRWTKFAGGGIRDAFRPVVDALSNAFRLGIYDFDKGHHYAPNDPHLDGRAMDVDTVNGESVGTTLTPKLQSFIDKTLQNPNVSVGVPKEIYAKLSAAQRARAFVDAPAHIHVQLDSVQPGQTIAPKGFAPSVKQGFVKDPQAKPTAVGPPPSWTNPMDSPGGTTGDLGGVAAPMVHSALNQFAGQGDLPFIMMNAQLRDADPKTGQADSILNLMRNPNSNVSKAMQMYRRDPAQAMDEYGLGSPAQNKYMAQNYPGTTEGDFSSFMDKNAFLNALYTFAGEQGNPMLMAEGLGAGKLLGLAGQGARAVGLDRVAQGAATAAHVGSPLYDLNRRGGVEASQWAKGTIASINAPHVLLKMPETNAVTKEIFGGLNQAQKDEVVRLYQHLPPDPTLKLEGNHADLERRAKLLAKDQGQVEAQQERTDLLPPERKFKKAPYFPMSRSYDFGPQYELEQQLKGGDGAAGGGMGTSQHKAFANLDDAKASGLLEPDHDLATNYATWRRQRLQRVAFEDAVARAPASVRRDVTIADFHNTAGIPPQEHYQQPFPGMERHGQDEAPDKFEQMDRAFADFNSRIVGPGRDVRTAELAKELGYEPKFGDPRRITPAGSPEWVSAVNLMPNPSMSPALKKSMVAPELWDFLRSNSGLQRYIGESSFQPGEAGPLMQAREEGQSGFDYSKQIAGNFVRHYTAIMRNMIISNFFFHPAVNISGNDAAARGVYNLGGPQFSVGGYAYNAAKALALQAGLVKPEAFVGGAQQYASWLDRAMKAGGVAEFGTPRYSALGGEYARVMTGSSKKFVDRLDRALTKAGDFNRERTFGSKGEETFAVSLFKDAVERGGMSDAKAGQVVREALGDYYNFDPKSPWSTFFFFMPWLKGNMKFWANTLVRRPQYVTGTTSALRNFGMQNSPESYEGPNPVGDFTTYLPGGRPMTIPFVGRDIGHLTQAAGTAAKGDLAGAGQPIQQMLAGRANPVLRGVLDAYNTVMAKGQPTTQGPESGAWNMIVNPHAPPDVQFHQAAGYFASHFIPVPLFSYALQDAARRGLSKEDLGFALLTAGGAGYFGEPKLDDMSKRQLSKAKKRYERAYYRYQDNHDGDALKEAWDTYMDRLQELGVTQ